MSAKTAQPSRAAIERLLRPRSVAIVGASPTPGSLGAGVLKNLERAGFSGAINLINPKRTEIGERPCLPSVEALPDDVDAAVLAIPRAGVLEAVRGCAARGVKGIVIFSAGFAEGGEEGRAEQEEIARIARAHDMAVEGPNCLGLVNFVDGAPLTFIETPFERLGERPGVGIVSQSGAMAAVVSVALRSRDLGVSFSVSTGNEAASGVEDYVEYLIDTPETQVISLMVEQFRQPKRFLELARRAHGAGKPIVLVHPGRSSAARASAATHTGALAGDYEVMRTKVRHAGVVLVETLEEMLDATELALRLGRLPRGGAAVLVESGWFKAQTLDLCEELGFPLPPLTEAGEAGLRAALPEFIPPSNPLDVTAQALVDPDLYRRTLAVLVEEPQYGAIVLPIIVTDEATARVKFPPILDALDTLKPEKPVLFAQVDEGAEAPQAYVDALRARGVPVFPSPERVYRALARLADAAERAPGPAAAVDPPPAELGGLHGVVPEHRAKAVLAEIGVPIPAGRLARTIEEAQAIAGEIGFPVVLKAQSPDLSHKSDAGGVVLGLATPQALAEGWARLHANVGAARPGLKLDGVLVEAMGRRGVELIVGARNDPDWGPVVLVGFGGVLAEAIKDARLLPPELSADAIVAELRKLRSAALFEGLRGSPPLDIEAAADIVSRVGRLIRSTDRIGEIDVNPVVVLPKGEGAVALDALMIMA